MLVIGATMRRNEAGAIRLGHLLHRIGAKERGQLSN
jgi:hypothetical protein